MVFIKTDELYNKILNLIEVGKIKQALMLTRKVLKKYPNSISIKMLYAKLLTYDEKTKLRGIDLMMKIYHSDLKYKSLIELGKQAKKYDDLEMARYFFEELKSLDKTTSIYAILELINLDMLEDKFDEAYILLKNNYNRLLMVSDEKTIDNMDFHIRYKLGLLNENDKIFNYYKRNLINYDEKDVLKHIKRHNFSSNTKNVHTKFNSSIDIYNLFTCIKEKIEKMKPDHSNSVDVYEIKCNSIIGNINGEDTNYLEVVTYINSKNILTMYPISKEIVCDKIMVKSR